MEGKSYFKHEMSHTAKQVTSSYEKLYNKPQQFESHMNSTLDSDLTLNAKDVERIFWEKLVKVGWRINKYNPDEKRHSYQLMLVCSDCNKIIDTQQSHTLTTSKIRVMTDKITIKRKITEHKATNKGCKPQEYDENGEVISKVELEAITGTDLDPNFEHLIGKHMSDWLDNHLSK